MHGLTHKEGKLSHFRYHHLSYLSCNDIHYAHAFGKTTDVAVCTNLGTALTYDNFQQAAEYQADPMWVSTGQVGAPMDHIGPRWLTWLLH